MATQDDYIRTALRVPPDLHAKIHESAKENNRTFNAEIVARLEQSFSTSTDQPDSLGYAVDQMLEWTMENERISREDALERLVAKGYSNENSLPVLIFYAAPGMTSAEIQAALQEANLVVPPDSAVFFEARRKKPVQKPPTA